MQKYYIGALFVFLFNISTAKSAATRDSIGVENLKGKKVIIHKVVAKDTYYSIGRRYNIPPKTIMSFNDDKYLQIDVIIKVPTELPFNEAVAAAVKKTPVSSQPTTQPPVTEGNYITYIVKPKDNLNKIAEENNTTVDEIKRINNLKTINLRIAQELKLPAIVPAPESSTATTPAEAVKTPAVQAPAVKTTVPTLPKPTVPSAPADASEEFVGHTVASNETIYSIATRYGITMDQLKIKNNLKDNSLRVGQKLLIKGQYPPAKPAYTPPVETEERDTTYLKDPRLRYAPSRYGLNQVDEKGTGVWIADQDLDASKMLVLHRTAPIGTVMKITNPMSNRSTFAKVVGKFTENETTKDVIIVMTKAVADALGALDKRFLCNLTYSGQASTPPDNEQ
ncbi:LysM peptidoglycan-binding domain-containing protein [Pedobacter sp. MC2016-14]|uniref:septal ring lytic transglycosylase RlpA family protein n=1 Tax=Pedobacter sp. MC2016-14 TaxID=2897327 RepID=UPI001E424174|nr:LysM peptidoglycan-binding domain-containing protein [Pedobacter sp. MC2016-14]MCD0488924.1 LysM peptidoglycan-binding domain-containing protein [Pedobacter sp. MC2016-14]